ncbi:MAG TPA: universal stress protein [Streptosporangiaceae bacterium]
MPGILVGVDGSDHSRQALTWAIHEASQRHVPLTVLAVRPPAARPATQIFWNIPTLEQDKHDPELARAQVQTWADKVANEAGGPLPGITVEVVTGDPAEELIRASRDADLLVLGSRGSGGFAKLLLGSVTSKVVHHAVSPTVVVPGPR